MKGPFEGGQPSRGSQRGTGRKKGQRAAGRTDRRQRRRDDVGVHVSGQAGGLAASLEPGQAGTQALPQPCPVVSGERKALAPQHHPRFSPQTPVCGPCLHWPDPVGNWQDMCRGVSPPGCGGGWEGLAGGGRGTDKHQDQRDSKLRASGSLTLLKRCKYLCTRENGTRHLR